MSEEGLSKVFREYEQAERSTSAKHGGTGLGLPITKKLAEMMGGDVIVTSELGVGSVFTYVPRECPQDYDELEQGNTCLLYTSPSPRDQRGCRLPSYA